MITFEAEDHQKNLKMASCNHTAIIEKINYTNEIMGQLRTLLLPYGVIDSSSEIARDLFDEAIRSLTSASSELRTATLPVEFKAYDEDEETLKLSDRKRSKLGKRAQISEVNKKRKVHLTLVTPIPHEDGYQWRKYGQKKITKEKFLRNYYKCTHFKDKGCPATKTVQQKSSSDYPPKFTVSYSAQHTCKTSETNSNQVITMEMDCKFVTSTQEDQTHACRSILIKPPSGDEASASVLEFEEFDAIGDTIDHFWDYEAITWDINELFPNF